MAVRIGVDLVSVRDVRDAIGAHGDRYLHRVFSDEELVDCAGEAKVDASRLAARFAAKEATIKVLRPGADEAVPWRDVAVRRGPSGVPELELDGAAATLASRARIATLAVSLTHERGYAGAVVVAETEPRDP